MPKAESTDKSPAEPVKLTARLLIVCLGNPGERFSLTRHNVGFMVCDRLIDKISRCEEFCVERQNFFHGEAYKVKYLGRDTGYLLKPNTYMNLSGVAVRAFFNSVDKEVRTVVVMDDFAIKLGVVRVRVSGSHGGHKGLASILNTLGTEEIPRIKVGIGPLPEGVSPEDFVLGRFSEEELLIIDRAIDKAAQIAIDALVNPDAVLSRNFSVNTLSAK